MTIVFWKHNHKWPNVSHTVEFYSFYSSKVTSNQKQILITKEISEKIHHFKVAILQIHCCM